jgi:hypothetical protein
MQAFLHSGDTCDTIIAEALRVGTQSQKQLDHRSSLQLQNEILDKLGEQHGTHPLLLRHLTVIDTELAHGGANRLESSIICLLDPVQLATDSPIRPVLAACLPVLRARITSLTTAQELIMSSKSNLEMILQLESLRLTA